MASRKGVPNKVGAQVKENILAVFNRLHGTAGMADWAKENLTEFYRIYARLIPTEVVGEVSLRNAGELTDAELHAIATSGRSGAAESADGPQSLLEVH